MKEPADSDLCVRCDHRWDEHLEDATEAWKTDCECCQSGEFIGDPVPIDDFPDPRAAAKGGGA